MAVELPEPLQWVLMLLAGTRWPEADEDALREMADRWRKTAKSVEDAGHAADNAVKQALDGQQGAAAESLTTFWAQYTVGKGTADQPGYFPGLVDSCNSMGDMLEEMANSAETAKIQIIASLAILAFDIATAEAEAPETLGVSLAQIPIAIAAGRAAVQALLKAFLKEVVTMAAKQAAQMAAINLMAQGIEVAQGHRKSIDFKEVGQAAEGGAVAGAAGHLIGKGVGEGGAALGLKGVMGTVPGKMATGAAVGVATDATTQAITTGHVDGSTLLGSGLGGAGAAGAHAAAGAFRGHSGPPSPEIPHHDLPPGQPHLDSTGKPVFTKSGNPNLGDREGTGLDGTGSGTGSGSGSTFRGVKDTSSQDDGGGTVPHGLSPFTLERDTGSPTGSGADRGGSTEPIGSTGSTGSVGSTGGRTTGSSRVEPEPEPQPAAPVQLNADRSPTPTDLPAENRSAVHEPEPMAPTVETPREAPAPTPVETTQIRPEAPTPVETTQIRPEAPTPVETTQIRTDAPAPEETVRPTPTVETPREAPAPTPVETTQIRPEAPTPVESTPIRTDAPTPVETTQIRTEAPTPVETTQIRTDAPTPVETTQIRPEAPTPVETTQIRTDAPTPVESTPIRTDAPTPVEAPASQSSAVPHPVLSGVHLDDTSMPAPVHSAVAVDPSAVHVPSPATAPASSHGGGDHEAQQQPVMAGAPPVNVPAGGGGGGRVEGSAFAPPTTVPRHDTPDTPPPPPAPGATARPITSFGGLRPAPERPAGPRPGSERPAPPPGTSTGTGTGRSAGGGTRQAATKPVDNRPPVLTSHTKWMAEGHSRDVFRTTDLGHANELVDKLPGMTPADRTKAIGSLDANGRHWLARNPVLVDRLRDELPSDEFARTAAHFMVNVDPRSEQPVAAREAARDQVARMLQDPHVAAELLKRGAAVTVVPKGVRMTDVPAFQRLAGATAGGASGGGRAWDTVRGSGGLHTAFAEENLLGGHTTVPGAGDYADGYSTSTHEFAHNIHQYGLSPADRKTITEAYQGKINTDDMTRMFGEETPINWSDGSRNLHDTDNDNYASRDELEYFAQVSNAYLGTNHGTDLYTGEARNNGPEWVKENEPDLLPLMERLYGKDPQAIHPEPANPINAVQEDHDLHEAVRTMLGDDGTPPPPPGHTPPAVPGQHVPPQHQPPAVPGQHVPPAAPTQHHEPATTVLEHHDPTTVQEQHEPPTTNQEHQQPADTGMDHQQPEATVPPQHEPPAVPGQHVPPAAPTQHHEPATTVLEHHDPTTVQEQHEPPTTNQEHQQPADTGMDHQQPEATVPPQHEPPAVPGQHVPPAAPTQHHEPATTVLEHHDPTTVQEQHEPPTTNQEHQQPADTGMDHQQPEATVPPQHEPPAVPGQHVPPAAPTQHHEPATTVLEHHDPTTVQEQHEPPTTNQEHQQPADTGMDHQQPEATVPPQHEPPLAPPPPPMPKQHEPTARPGSSARHDPPPAPPVAPLKRDGSDVSMGSGSERESDDDASMGRVSDTSMGRGSDASMGRHSETESESDSDESMRSGSQDSRTGPPRPPVEQRRPLPVGVHLDVPEDRTDKLAGHEVTVSEISISADRPMTRYGGNQRSHTVPWTLTRRAVGGLAGRNAHQLWTELKTEVKELREYKPRGTGAEAKDAAKVATRWDDILDRLDRLPEAPPGEQPLHEWHEQLGDLLSGYVELSQLTSFASFADGRAVGRGEHSTMKGLDQAEQNAAKEPKPQEDKGTGDESDEEPVGENNIGNVVRNKLLDLKENKSLTPEDVVAAKRHLARGLIRSFPKLMEGKEGPAILEDLGFTKTNPPPDTYGSGKQPKQGFLADVSVKPGGADGPRVGRIMLSDKDRPPTQFGGGGQLSHTGSWSLLRGTLLSFEGRGTRELGNWLGDRFSGMETVVRDMPGHADDLKAIKEAQKQLSTLDSASDHEVSRKLGGLLETFVTVHQKMPFASFPDHLQGGTASGSGEIDLPVAKGGHDGAPVGPKALASHFDGAAPYGMGLKDLAHSYQDWKAHAEVLGPVDQEAINQLAGRTFTKKNLRPLRSGTELPPITARGYLRGLENWDRGMSLVFKDKGEQAVQQAWAEHRDEFTLGALGTFHAGPHAKKLGDWLDAVTSADRPTAAPQALAALTRYYHGLVNAGSTRSQAKAAELKAFADAVKTYEETPATAPPSHDEISLRLESAMLGNTVPRDGDCLYHAVNAANGTAPSHHAALDLRSRVTDWVLQDENLNEVRTYAQQNGVTMDKVVETLATTGNWAGDAGDLAPRIVASALGVEIRIHRPGDLPVLKVSPLILQPGRVRPPIELDLQNDHYTVHVPDDATLIGKRQGPEVSEPEYSADESSDEESGDDSDGYSVQDLKRPRS